MAEQVLFTLVTSMITSVTCDWIQLPKVSPTLTTSDPSSTTPLKTVFVTFLTNTTKPANDTSMLQTHEKRDKNTDKRSNEDQFRLPPPRVNDSQHQTSGVNSDEDSKIVKETFQNLENEFFNQPCTSVKEKLDYLTDLQIKLYNEIRRYSKGIWKRREARTKKLMGFGTIEGALMTIAFLTFSVFLIKIVFQFIRGLQNQDMMMLMNVNPTISSSGRRSRHVDDTLAAAQLLQYMDEFSIKHRERCESP